MGADLSAWVVLDSTDKLKMEQVECITAKKTHTPERVRKTLELDRRYSFQKIGVDDGGLGSGDFGYLLENEQTRRKVVALNNSTRQLNRDGTKKKRLLKEDMYNNLLALMEHRSIQLLKDDDVYHSLRSVQFEIIKGRAFYRGDDTHIAEALIRAAWLASTKSLNIYIL